MHLSYESIGKETKYVTLAGNVFIVSTCSVFVCVYVSVCVCVCVCAERVSINFFFTSGYYLLPIIHTWPHGS